MNNILNSKGKKRYKFSIISAVYNTEPYLDVMIQSLINQDIGFQDNVQLILINDGSSDKSLDICNKYKDIYPDIIIENIEHQGVSNARNIGLTKARGKYINFLDSDDYLEKDVLSKVWYFFEENYRLVDVVAIPLYFFDNMEGAHILNQKFIRTRVIDILDEYKSIQLSSSSAFIKKEVLSKLKFNTNLRYAEDALFLTKVILDKKKYGVVADTKYYYRRRKDVSSAIQNWNNKEWYLSYIKNFSEYLMRYLDIKEQKGALYIQYLVMYDLQWRINNLKKIGQCLEKKEQEEFFVIFIKIIKIMKVNIILQQQYLNIYRKILLVGLKYSKIKRVNLIILNILRRK